MIRQAEDADAVANAHMASRTADGGKGGSGGDRPAPVEPGLLSDGSHVGWVRRGGAPSVGVGGSRPASRQAELPGGTGPLPSGSRPQSARGDDGSTAEERQRERSRRELETLRLQAEAAEAEAAMLQGELDAARAEDGGWAGSHVRALRATAHRNARQASARRLREGRHELLDWFTVARRGTPQPPATADSQLQPRGGRPAAQPGRPPLKPLGGGSAEGGAGLGDGLGVTGFGAAAFLEGEPSQVHGEGSGGTSARPLSAAADRTAGLEYPAAALGARPLTAGAALNRPATAQHGMYDLFAGGGAALLEASSAGSSSRGASSRPLTPGSVMLASEGGTAAVTTASLARRRAFQAHRQQQQQQQLL